MSNIITLAHGSGGKITHELIKDIFFKYFKNDILNASDDSADLTLASGNITFTTDSFVVQPIFFPGGDIGKLAVCGTVNDLAVNGADPKFLSCGFIIEEGFDIARLEKIVRSMAHWAGIAGVRIVTGDTKVVEKGAADGLFINTAGIGVKKAGVKLGMDAIRAGDRIIITGTIGDHGIAVLSTRKGLSFKTGIKSDCAPLNYMLGEALDAVDGIKFMRDPTRGGVATTLNEMVGRDQFGILIEEKNIPIAEETRAACELLGLDPLYIANEGKVLLVVDPAGAEKTMKMLQSHNYGKQARVIGTVTSDNPGKVCIKTFLGVTRFVDMLTGEPMPRIC